MKASVWRSPNGRWHYMVGDLMHCDGCIPRPPLTWREAFDAACTELRKRAES